MCTKEKEIEILNSNILNFSEKESSKDLELKQMHETCQMLKKYANNAKMLEDMLIHLIQGRKIMV